MFHHCVNDVNIGDTCNNEVLNYDIYCTSLVTALCLSQNMFSYCTRVVYTKALLNHPDNLCLVFTVKSMALQGLCEPPIMYKTASRRGKFWYILIVYFYHLTMSKMLFRIA